MAESGGRLSKRLERILLMLPYVIAHPGVEVSELASRFEVKEKELVKDLQMLWFCGLPGYGPGDLIEVSLDGDRVSVDMADYFSKALRITPAQALALYAGGEAVASLPGMEKADALRRALTKLGAALDAGAGESPGISVTLEPGSSRHLEGLQEALTNKIGVVLEYLSASRGELTERTVEPWGLIAAHGHWYLVGLDHLSGEERMFRTDRIKSVTGTGDPVEIPADFDPDAYKGAFSGHGSATLTLEITPSVAEWFEDYYPVSSAESLEDGWRRVSLVAGGERWGATLIARLGSDVRNVQPPEMLAAARALATSIAARYE
ncbi:MAG: helix-turn-helix transcriptional regulator [Actinomycetota bacterium]